MLQNTENPPQKLELQFLLGREKCHSEIVEYQRIIIATKRKLQKYGEQQ
ncbi:MAG: hypothetical protein JEY94_09280 [Melioribacteraceae bacterium]|nr:hypothetical protein [Melioribacteraceae bacterium]